MTSDILPACDEFGCTIRRGANGKFSAFIVGLREKQVVFFVELTSNRVISAALRNAATGLDMLSQGLSRGKYKWL